MKQASVVPSAFLKIGILAVLVAALAGLGLAMWMENGAAMFMSMVQTGLAWCF